MIRSVAGYFLGGLGFIGVAYFRSYKGSEISHPMLWLLLCLVVGIAGFLFSATGKSRKRSKQEKFNRERLTKLKETGERIILTIDSCEVRENNYYEERVNEHMSKAEMIDASFDSNRNYSQIYKVQSAIIYYYNSGSLKEKMVSQSFPIDAETLKKYIESKEVSLYINKLDKNDYVFDLAV